MAQVRDHSRLERFTDTMVSPGDTLNIGSVLFQVDWTEPWLMGLITFHIVTLSLTLLTRDRGNVQAGLFVTALLLVYFSEALNELAARHWRAFSSHQYFDSQGMFISLVFSMPLLLNCIIMVGQWMWTSGNLMIRIKQAQLREEIRRQRSANSSHSKGSKGD
ncbi:transmembrane protein 18 [Dermacentor andersoni]|uniref:transmembrane protein 18 n=1 Tax=Dermacentor andersoni TaxID=34620 RepID=UPI0021557B5B|nr:transmembrane protein 18-like [Dermacentor andersoni]XP_050033851.1 transmembrane protein 18-like [Dermacentor andersoni]